MPITRPGSVRLLALIALLVFAAMAATPASAQPDPTVNRVTVAAVLCDDASCAALGDRLTGFAITGVDRTSGEALASCVTQAGTQSEGCVLELPAGVEWDLTWDEAQVPAGYGYAGYQIHMDDGPLGPITYIPFAPLQAVEPIEEPGHMVVQAALCADATCNAFSDYLDLFVISAVDPATGEEFSSCATGNLQQGLDHQCILDVPADGDVALVWHDDQVPAGYVSFGDPFPVGDPVVTTLGFVPVSGEEPVTTLPSTGTARWHDADSSTPALLLVASLLAALASGLLRASTPPALAAQRQHVDTRRRSHRNG